MSDEESEKMLTLERNRKILESAISLLNEFAAATENILYRHQSQEHHLEQMARIEGTEEKLRLMLAEVECE